MKSKMFFKIGFSILAIFLLSFLTVFLIYNNQDKKEYNLWQEAIRAKYFDIMDGEVLTKDTVIVNNKEYNLLELKHSDFLGNSDINIYLFEENLKNLNEVEIGEYLTIYCNDLELPYVELNEDDGILITAHSIIENKPIYSDILVCFIIYGLPSVSIIFIVNMIIFLVLKLKERKLEKEKIINA